MLPGHMTQKQAVNVTLVVNAGPSNQILPASAVIVYGKIITHSTRLNKKELNKENLLGNSFILWLKIKRFNTKCSVIR